MAEPLLPHPSSDSDKAIPSDATGSEGSSDEARLGVPDEPDVLEGPSEADAGIDVHDRPDTPFRTPTPGARLSPEDLADEN